MIKNLRKKGFTIVELVIVIAVIAILAAILIPTFSGIIKKANIASDTAMAKNMNTALVMADSEGNVPEDMGDVLFTLFEAGYVLENLNPTTNGYYFVWDEGSNQILFLTDAFEVHYSSQPYSEDTLNWWMPMDEADDKITGQQFSYCMAADLTANFEFDYLANFDTNGFTLTGNLNYVSNDQGSFSVSGIVKGTLTVNTPEASVYHYGAVDNVEIIEVASASYHEHGFVRVTLNLTKGRLVIENSGSVQAVTLPVQADGSAENKGHIGTLNADDGDVVIVNSGYIENVVAPGGGEAQAPTGEPAGTPPTGYSILISNRTELQAFRDAVNAGMRCIGLTVKLTSDIDLSNRYWKPIGLNNKHLTLRHDPDETPDGYTMGWATGGSIERPGKYSDNFRSGDKYLDKGPANVFMGTFDGNGKTIKGLTNTGYIAPSVLYWVNAANTNGYAFGLFSVTYDATIKNLNMTNVNIVSTSESSACVGGIVGGARGSLTMDNCSVKGNIQGTDGVGGAVGYVYLVNTDSTPDQDHDKTVEFNNVRVEGNIHAKTNEGDNGQRAGGIIGTVLMYNLFNHSHSLTPNTSDVVVFASSNDNIFRVIGCSFKGTVLADANRAAGLFANSGGGDWLKQSSNMSSPTTAELTVMNNTVDGTITAGDRVSRFFTTGSSSNTQTYTNFTNLSGNTFVDGGKIFEGTNDVTTTFTGTVNN